MAIKTFHEAPMAIFSSVQLATDGDYALVNLFETHLEYFKEMVHALEIGREVILDNGVFELGEAFSSERFAFWVRALQPTYYIVPDVLEDYPKTVQRFVAFRDQFPHLPGKVMAVAQGANPKDFIQCYQALEPLCDKIGISFDCSWYHRYSTSDNPWVRLMEGRQRLLTFMDDMGIINHEKPHHLLGVALPQDMQFYKDIPWVDSVDTSNPVVHGLKGIRYSPEGLQSKETQKLYTMIGESVSGSRMEDIMYNIQEFRRYCGND